MDKNFYTPRKLKFKAWDPESRLLMRLNNIECIKGELVKKNHILLQFTGLMDKQGEELYEMDIILMSSVRFYIAWNADTNGWCLKKTDEESNLQSLTPELIRDSIRLMNYFESSKNE